MLVTGNRRYAYRAALVRNHGEVAVDGWWGKGPAWRELVLGSNYRLTELQAAIMVEQLKRLAAINKERSALADYLSAKLKKFLWLQPVRVLPRSRHAYYLYPMRFFAHRINLSRSQFVARMNAKGFELREGYEKPVYLLPLYQRKRMYEHSQFPFVSKEYPHTLNYRKGICPVAERMHAADLIVSRFAQSPSNRNHIDRFTRELEFIDARYGA